MQLVRRAVQESRQLRPAGTQSRSSRMAAEAWAGFRCGYE